MKNKVLIFKNDRTGDLFSSTKVINKILQKHKDQDILIYLSNINHKFSFLFPNFNKKIYSMKLTFYEKIKIFFYLLFNNIETIYILTPKDFYYYLPIFFRKIKFYAITIKGIKNRPKPYLLKFLHKYVVINRLNIQKRFSTYKIQESLIENFSEINHLNTKSILSHKFIYPNNYVYFHYKKNLFQNLLQWDFDKILQLIEFLNERFENVIFSSEIFDEKCNDYFSSKFNTFDFNKKKEIKINEKKVIFLKDIDGYDLFHAIKKSKKIISPEGIITHIAYYLKKPILSLLFFKLKDRRDFINQIISCKEWFPPDNYEYTVLKKDFKKSLDKINKRI